MAVLAINGGERVHTSGWPKWPPADLGYEAALKQVLDSGVWSIQGEFVGRSAEAMARFHDARHAVPVTSGTTALELGLRATGVGVGDEVIVPPYTFIATATAVLAVGAVPVFVDVDAETFNLAPALIEAAVTEHTAAIIPVHLYGSPAALDPILEIAKKRNLVVVEDACQAHGAEYKGRKVGALAHCGAFSFQASKNVCAGEGGMLLTNDRPTYEKAWSLANIGRVIGGEWYEHHTMGWNMRLTQFQAALVLHGLERLPDDMACRERNARVLRQRLADIDGVALQELTHPDNRSAYHAYAVRYDREAFDGLRCETFTAALRAEGIPGRLAYNPLYKEGLFAANWDPNAFPFARPFYNGHVDYRNVHCPVCEHLCTDGAFLMPQTIGLADEAAMHDIADAIVKVQRNVSEIEG